MLVQMGRLLKICGIKADIKVFISAYMSPLEASSYPRLLPFSADYSGLGLSSSPLLSCLSTFILLAYPSVFLSRRYVPEHQGLCLSHLILRA